MKLYTKARKVFDKLIEAAFYRRHLIATPDNDAYNKKIKAGEEIPEHLLPGRLIMKLSDVERQELSELTSEDTQDRID